MKLTPIYYSAYWILNRGNLLNESVFHVGILLLLLFPSKGT